MPHQLRLLAIPLHGREAMALEVAEAADQEEGEADHLTILKIEETGNWRIHIVADDAEDEVETEGHLAETSNKTQ